MAFTYEYSSVTYNVSLEEAEQYEFTFELTNVINETHANAMADLVAEYIHVNVLEVQDSSRVVPGHGIDNDPFWTPPA